MLMPAQSGSLPGRRQSLIQGEVHRFGRAANQRRNTLPWHASLAYYFAVNKMSNTGTRREVAATVDDWRRLTEVLQSEERQLDLRLREAADGVECATLLQQRTHLRAARELCEAFLVPAEHEHRNRTPDSEVLLPGTAGLAALNLQVSHARRQAMRAAHTVLVVDDHPPTLYVATRWLKRAGYRVMEAATGEEALLLSSKASALLLDVNLPDVNGVEVCHAIKKNTRHKPVVLMSAVFTDELHQDAGKSAGADLYLTSLLDGAQLANSFDSLLAPQFA
jgi:CheY-like chemotaxis protein